MGKIQVKLEIHQEDLQRLWKLAGRHDMEPIEILERFVADLTYGNSSGGSDERDLANKWFKRSFSICLPGSFIGWMCEDSGEMEGVMEEIDYIREVKEEIALLNDFIVKDEKYYASGNTRTTYGWEDGVRQEITIGWNEWTEQLKEYKQSLADAQEELASTERNLHEYWERFKNFYEKHYSNYTGDFKEDMKKAEAWIGRYKKIAEDGEEEPEESANYTANETVPKL